MGDLHLVRLDLDLDLDHEPEQVVAQIEPPESQGADLSLLGRMALLVGEVGSVMPCPLGDED
jgi:hypothetical protein